MANGIRPTAPTARLAASACALVVLIGACGGREGRRPVLRAAADAAVPPSEPCAASTGYELERIEDFEETFQGDRWWVGTEPTPACQTMQPSVVPREGADCTLPLSNGAKLAAPDALPEPRCESSLRGVHIKGAGFTQWGGNLTYSFAFGTDQSQWKDASGWEGISFWIRGGDEATPGAGRTLFIALGEPSTDSKGGLCRAEAEAPLAQKCDAFGAGVGIEPTWRFVTLRFDMMKQRGFGVPVHVLDASKIRSIVFNFDVGDWDFWIDDVAFFRSESK